MSPTTLTISVRKSFPSAPLLSTVVQTVLFSELYIGTKYILFTCATNIYCAYATYYLKYYIIPMGV